MWIEHLTVCGSGPINEDTVVINHDLNLFGVIDGVSSLVQVQNATDRGGFKASRLFKRILEESTTSKNKSLSDIVRDANRQLRQDMELAGVDLANKSHLWGCACALIRVHDDYVEYAQIGDCMIFYVNEDQSWTVLTESQVHQFDEIALKSWREGIDKGIKTREELSKLVKPILQNNRLRSNCPGGYGVFNGEEEAMNFVRYGRQSISHHAQIVMLSDGLFHPEDNPSAPSWDKTIGAILSGSLSGYTEQLLRLEVEDEECIQYPRFKTSDDKTGLILHI